MGWLFEKGPGIRSGFRDLKFNKNNISQFIVSLVFSLTGAVVVFVDVGTKAGFTTNQTTSFIAFAYIIAGIVSTLMTLYYKQPLLAMPTITAIIVIGKQLANYNVTEMAGAFILSSLIMLILGMTGIIGKAASKIPMPIIMGMLAGAYMSNGTAIVTGVQSLPLIGLITVAVYLLIPYILPKVPRQVAAVVVCLALTFILVPAEYSTGNLLFIPQFYTPKFNGSSFINLCIPLTLLSIADFLRNYGILKTNGYEPPTKALLTLPAIGSAVGAFTLAVPMSMTGVITGILSGPENGPKETRYVGAYLKNLSAIGIGILSGFLVPFLLVLPSPLKSVLAGLAMLSLFFNALGGAFGGKKFKYGALFAFLVTLSGISVFGINSAVWGVIVGVIVSFCMEPKDFKADPAPAAAVPAAK